MKGAHESCTQFEADLAEVTRQREALADALMTCRSELRNYERTDTGERVGAVTEAIRDAEAALFLAGRLQ